MPCLLGRVLSQVTPAWTSCTALLILLKDKCSLLLCWHVRDKYLTQLCKCSNGRCPCLDSLPGDLLERVWDLIEESQRHYALTLIHRYWERSGTWPKNVPSLMPMRGNRFCFSCDSQDHRYNQP